MFRMLKWVNTLQQRTALNLLMRHLPQLKIYFELTKNETQNLDQDQSSGSSSASVTGSGST